ncbi:MAG: hypothetical protein MMC23_001258 [Stictis urceolatum]|nr:hypothetical protein [Stictis urceolata]
MSTPKPTIAFIGATGGCTNACLVLSLNSGHTCTALARTPSKLQEMLLGAGVPESTLTSHLRIVKGDIRDASAVQSLLRPSPADAVVDLIISGIGMVMGRNSDGDICKDATRCVLAALDTLAPPRRPFLLNISSTGISSGPRDVPLAMMLPYYLLAKPHADKRVMETETAKAREAGKIGGFALVRPSFLTDGKECGMEKIRAGSAERPEVGYTISRKDVGRWIFEEIVSGDRMSWDGKRPSITH